MVLWANCETGCSLFRNQGNQQHLAPQCLFWTWNVSVPYYPYFKTKVKIIQVTEASDVTLRIAIKAGREVTSRCQLSDRKEIRTANTIQAKMLSILPGKNFEKKIVTKNI